MTVAGQDPAAVYQAAAYKPIPNLQADITVGAASAQTTLAVYAGQFIRLKAVDADITFLRGTHTLVDGVGMVLAEGEEEEFYVDPEGELTLAHIAGGAAKTLRVFYSKG